jgi:hypothetical protein
MLHCIERFEGNVKRSCCCVEEERRAERDEEVV